MNNESPEQDQRRCVKCGGSDVLFVEPLVVAFGAGNVIPLSGWFVNYDSVKVDRYVCMSCGFCEEWVMNPEDREALRRWYQPGSRRARINERRHRWRQFFADLKRRLFGGGTSGKSEHREEKS
ncbi:MAG: hypothetical protein KDA78_17690 [Planctomycetaceae bacterium]|nr:hypothetical protein [Planctomycetaceae bacterium]